MNRLLLGAAALAFCACSQPSLLPSSSGSLAVSRDDLTLYVADADHDRVTLLDAKTGAVLRHVPVARAPERLAVAKEDGAVFVTSRGARTVTRLTADGEVAATATVGAEPVGLALSRDGKLLFVANSQSGTLSELDAATLEPRAEYVVGGNPYAVAAHPDDDRLYVSDFLEARVQVFSRGRGGTIARATLEQPPSAECPNGWAATRTPSQAADLVLSNDGARAYVAHTQSRSGQDGAAFGLAFAVAPALSTVDTASESTLREPVTSRPTRLGTLGASEPAPDFPAPILATDLDDQCARAGNGNGMDAPSSLVADPLGEWIFVADHNSNAVAVVSATRRNDPSFESPERGIFGVVRVGARPTGLAVSSDLKTAWVHNALDYSVSVVELQGGKLVESKVLTFGQSDLPPSVERGRRLFYSAVDTRLTEPTLGGVSCSSCHPSGRTDGLVWALAGNTLSWTQPAPRSTPALWRLAGTAPYAWSGNMPDLSSFTTHMVEQMGGDGLNRLELADIGAFMLTLEPPDRGPALSPEAEQAGQTVFARACGSCHSGAALTDGQRHTVGGQSLDTPSLVGVGATPPYLHDGSSPSLESAWRHGGALSSDEQRALGAWLRTR